MIITVHSTYHMLIYLIYLIDLVLFHYVFDF